MTERMRWKNRLGATRNRDRNGQSKDHRPDRKQIILADRGMVGAATMTELAARGLEYILALGSDSHRRRKVENTSPKCCEAHSNE